MTLDNKENILHGSWLWSFIHSVEKEPLSYISDEVKAESYQLVYTLYWVARIAPVASHWRKGAN